MKSPTLLLVTVLAAAVVGVSAQSALPVERNIRLLIEVRHRDKVVMRDIRAMEPLAPYYLPVGPINNQPAVLRCESKFLSAQVVRTGCQFLSGADNPGVTKARWAESRIGTADKISFQDLRGELVVVSIQPIYPDFKAAPAPSI